MRRGRGFSYLGPGGEPVTDPDALARIRELAVPPAWTDVWICADPLGHLQATGTDAAGRKQYLYHARWREQRDREKFARMLRFARVLPKVRRAVRAEVTGTEHLSRERVLGCAVRMLDLGGFRVGGERYADDDGGLGLATVRREHVSVTGAVIRFDYPAKAGVRRVQSIADPPCAEVVRALLRRRSGGPELLAYRAGRRWVDVDSSEVNEHLKDRAGAEFSAKDFRTWNATVLAAVAVAADGRAAANVAARRRIINRAVRGVAELLGNTPAVARRSYIDPRVFDRFLSGWTIAAALRGAELDAVDERTRARIERAVLALLEDPLESPGVERIAA